MLAEQFYDILDKELEIIIAENQVDIAEKKLNQVNQQKGYALLIWFLKVYAPTKITFKDYITEGKDDSSCDIIFSNKENGEEIFYIVQSKWNTKPKIKEGNQPEKISSDEVKKAIVDFESIFRTDKRKGSNEFFNKRLEDLHKHRIENGGAVKFIFLGLLPHNDEVNEYIRNFEANYTPCKLEIMDIERLKRDYIEFKYKQIEVNNPLAYRHFNPTEDKIILPIERIENSMGKGDHLKIEKPYEAYILLLKPKTIFDLFQKYKFSLFFDNVRNPLPESNYNQAIVDTLNTSPGMFWYFNNGITAISTIIKAIGFDSQVAHLSGLQIINGSQTVYSIYEAYKNASALRREVLDAEVKITLRLIRSSDENVNLKITRYTNSQNPMEERDFWANDAVQVRLQEESFKTKYWYEKRRGEFRSLPDGITVISHTEVANSYVPFHLSNINRTTYLLDKLDILRENKTAIFTSQKESKDGLYEIVFNENTYFEDILSAFLMWQIWLDYNDDKDLDYSDSRDSIPFIPKTFKMFLPLSKIVFQKYIHQQYNSTANFNKLLKKYFEKDRDFLVQIFLFIDVTIANKYAKIIGVDVPDYEGIKKYFESLLITKEIIENVKLE